MPTRVRRDLLESLPVAIIGTDKKGHIRAVNRAALEMFSYDDPAELLDQPVEVLIPKRYSQAHASYHSGYTSEPQARPMGKGRDLWALRRDGSEFPVEIGLTHLPGPDEELFLASIVDISVRKAAEKTLLQRQRELESFLAEKTRQLEAEIDEKSRLEERQRLGRDLHDSISQSLYGIGLGIRTAIAKTERQQDPRAALDYVLSLTESALVEMRALLFKLRPKSLENVPLCDILRSHLKAVGLRHEIETELICEDEPPEDVNFEFKNAVYRITTEALHNCVKHADASSIKLRVRRREQGLEFEIEDDGKGFNPENGTGHGLQTMKERAEGRDGRLQIESSPQGSLVRAWLPL